MDLLRHVALIIDRAYIHISSGHVGCSYYFITAIDATLSVVGSYLRILYRNLAS